MTPAETIARMREADTEFITPETVAEFNGCTEQEAAIAIAAAGISLAGSRWMVLPGGFAYEGKLQLSEPTSVFPDGRPLVEMAECGHCGFRWNDALITSLTPAPAARCPDEYAHVYED